MKLYKNKITFLLILSFIFFKTLRAANSECSKEGSSRSSSLKLKEKILCNYDKEFRPIKDQNKSINITIRLVLKSLDVNDRGDEITIHNWIGLLWQDEYLKWDPKEYSSIELVHLATLDIWTPDLQIFKNGKSDTAALSLTTVCVAWYWGKVSCVSDDTHTAKCTNNLQNWPYDTRSCFIEYSTGVHNESQVRIVKTKKPLKLGAYFKNPQWELINGISSYFTGKNFMTTESFQGIKFTFNLKRHSYKTTAILIVPIMALIIMTLTPLWMSPTNTERFCIVATNLFSHFLLIEHISYITPEAGLNTPKIVSFYRDSLFLALIVLIELTFIKSLLSSRNAKKSSPMWLLKPCKFITNSIFGRNLLIDDIPDTTSDRTTENEDQTENNKGNKTKNFYNEKCLIATVVDRVLFILFSLAYFLMTVCLIPFN